MDSKAGRLGPVARWSWASYQPNSHKQQVRITARECLSPGNIAGFVLTSPAARPPSFSLTALSLSFSFFSLYRREHRVLETIVDVTAWHFLCKEDKYVGAGGWREATLKATETVG